MKYELIKVENCLLSTGNGEVEIKTENYLIAVEDGKVEKGQYGLNFAEGIKGVGKGYYIFHHNGSNLSIINSLGSKTRRIVAHLPLQNSPLLDGLDTLPPLLDGFDLFIEEPLTHYIREKRNQDECHGFIDGFNKAKEIYKYTEEDLRKAINMAKKHDKIPNHDGVVVHFEHSKDEIIQSLNQPKLPTSFECEVEPKYEWVGAVKGVKGSGSKLRNQKAGQPKKIWWDSKETWILIGNYEY